jgi:hypothetical protein
MFWFHFYGAIQRDRPMSTEWAREKTVEELDLQNLTDAEAVRLLELANEGVYDTDDVPERWRTLSRGWNRNSEGRGIARKQKEFYLNC